MNRSRGCFVKKVPSPYTSNLTLRTKMMLLSSAAIGGILAVALIGLFLLNEARIGGPAYTSIQKNKDALESMALLKADLYQINNEMNTFLNKSDAATIKRNSDDIKNLMSDIELNFGIVLESVESEEKRTAVNKIETIWKEYQETITGEIVPAALSGNITVTNSLIHNIQAQRFETFITSVALMVDLIRKDVTKTEKQVAAGIRNKSVFAGLVIIMIVGLIALFSYLITVWTTRPMRACLEFAQDVAGGKLDARLTVAGGGETADLAAAMNTMAENLHSMVSRISSATAVLTTIDHSIEKASRQMVTSAHLQESAVKETSQAIERIEESINEVSDGVDKLSSSSAETSSSTLEMAASIEEVAISADKLSESVDEVSSSIFQMTSSIKEIGSSIVNLLDASNTTASSIAEMDATIRQVEKNAMDTSAISEGVKNDAETGKRAVEEAIAGMQAIRDASRITAEVIETLSLRATDIGAILSVIDEVAEQTNLLALNATIIAAQAGEHGKGFAVVADEIRELAERTSSSTREIATVIHAVQEETGRAVDAINLAEQSISEGEKLSHRSGAALEKIVGGVKKASVQIHEIARASVEQAHGSRSIKEAMESVAEMVEQIANSACEHSNTSELIAKAVERMKELTLHVRLSTREQSHTSGLIAHATEDVTAMIEQFRDACRSQVQSSAMISKAVFNIEASSTANTETAKVMEGSVAGLSKQIELLEKEMSGFKI